MATPMTDILYVHGRLQTTCIRTSSLWSFTNPLPTQQYWHRVLRYFVFPGCSMSYIAFASHTSHAVAVVVLQSHSSYTRVYVRTPNVFSAFIQPTTR